MRADPANSTFGAENTRKPGWPLAPSGRRPSIRTLMYRGLRRRCPACGARVYESWFRPAARCPRCSFPTTRTPDQWIGAYGLHIIVSFTLLVATIAIGFAVTYPQPPVGLLLAVCVTVALVVPVVFQPISRSLWAAIDAAMRPPEAADFDLDAQTARSKEGADGAPVHERPISRSLSAPR